MKFEVEQKTLYGALQKIIGVVPAKSSIPVIQNILFGLEGNNLILTGTDLETSVVATIQVTGEKDGTVAIPAKRIFDIVRELPDLPITISTDKNKIVLATEKGNYKISGESSEDFPVVANEKASEQIKDYPTAKFLRMVQKTVFAVSTDELRAVLQGVLLEVQDDQLRMVATDGHRLAKIEGDSGIPAVNRKKKAKPDDSAIKVIMPTKALQLLTKSGDESETLSVAVTDSQITFSLGDTTIYSKLINGKFPDYGRVIPKDNGLTLIVDRDLLAASVGRADIFANDVTHNIELELGDNQLIVSSEDNDKGCKAKEMLDVQHIGSTITIGYNAEYVKDALRHIDGEEVLIRLKDPGSAALIEPVQQKENEHYVMVLMPINLNKDEK